jgi:hypothetical protein
VRDVPAGWGSESSAQAAAPMCPPSAAFRLPPAPSSSPSSLLPSSEVAPRSRCLSPHEVKPTAAPASGVRIPPTISDTPAKLLRPVTQSIAPAISIAGPAKAARNRPPNLPFNSAAVTGVGSDRKPGKIAVPQLGQKLHCAPTCAPHSRQDSDTNVPSLTASSYPAQI